MRRNRLTLGLLALTMAIAGCQGPATYRPASLSSEPGSRTGFWDYRIEDNRFRVNFAGNSMTSREAVERYLLFRAAELTLQQGYDWFEMADRATERKSQTYIDRPFATGPMAIGAHGGLIVRRGSGGGPGTPSGAIRSGTRTSMSASSTAMRPVPRSSWGAAGSRPIRGLSTPAWRSKTCVVLSRCLVEFEPARNPG